MMTIIVVMVLECVTHKKTKMTNYIHHPSFRACNTQKNQNAKHNTLSVATPLWPSVGVKLTTPKVGDLESCETLKCLEFDSKAQNSSH